jgi:hypothetical protein
MITIRRPRAVSAGPGRIAEAVRRFICCLLFLGLLARGLIPTGYMPERDAHNGDLIVAMCSGSGAMQTIHLAPIEAPAKGKTAGQHCPFAALSPPVLPQPSLVVDAPVSIVQTELSYLPPDIVLAHAAWSASAPPTGPPMSA